MAFRYKGNTAAAVREEDVLAEVTVGGMTVKAVKCSSTNRSTGEDMHFVQIVGCGKPTRFGAQKFCAIMELSDAIAEHFRSVGQIEDDE
jgi:hypothetical protein